MFVVLLESDGKVAFVLCLVLQIMTEMIFVVNGSRSDVSCY